MTFKELKLKLAVTTVIRFFDRGTFIRVAHKTELKYMDIQQSEWEALTEDQQQMELNQIIRALT